MGRMRIAYFSPLNPRKTGISDYSEELLPALAELAEVDLFTDGYTPTNPAIRDHFSVYDCAEFAHLNSTRHYDINLYQMGNSLQHATIYRTLMRYPGIVVLHDVVLHHFFLELARQCQDASLYLREMAYSHGVEGIETGLAAWRGEMPPPLFEYPLIDRVVQVSLGVIVHSEYARRQVTHRTSRELAVVPAHINPPPVISPAERVTARAELKVPYDSIVFGAFGHATPAKRLDVVLRAFARLHSLMPDTFLIIVGEVNPKDWLSRLVSELGLEHAVNLTGAVPLDVFHGYIPATDVCVNLRYPTAGETSASLLRIMAAGIPTIVSSIGSFAEFPDSCCCKIPIDSTEERELFLTLRVLATDAELRRHVGDAARAYVLRQHAPTGTARGYVNFAEEILTGMERRVRQSSAVNGGTGHQLTHRARSSPPSSHTVALIKKIFAETLSDLGVREEVRQDDGFLYGTTSIDRSRSEPG